MDEMAVLKPKLTRLKLSGVLETLSERLDSTGEERVGAGQDFANIRLQLQSSNPRTDDPGAGHLPVSGAKGELLFSRAIGSRKEPSGPGTGS